MPRTAGANSTEEDSTAEGLHRVFSTQSSSTPGVLAYDDRPEQDLAIVKTAMSANRLTAVETNRALLEDRDDVLVLTASRHTSTCS